MKPSSPRSNQSCIRSFLLIPLLGLLSCVLLTSCYEGWNRPKVPGDGGGGVGKPGPGAKTIGVAILDAIVYSAEALRTPGCTPVPTSFAELRAQESAARSEAVKALLTEQAEVVKVFTTVIKPQDCRNINRVLKARWSANSGPYLNDVPPALRAKPAVHVRLVSSNGDFSPEWPDWQIYADDWADIKFLGSKGFTKRLSVMHFALTNSSSYGSYFGKWYYNSVDRDRFSATTIETPVPSEEGVAEVQAAVEKSSMDFAQWLAKRVSEL